MKQKQQISGTLILLALFAIGVTAAIGLLSIHATSQDGAKVDISVAAPPTPALQGKAIGKVEPLELKSNDVRADILAHPAPTVSLLFTSPPVEGEQRANSPENQSSVSVPLPAEASKVFVPYWKAYLAFCYETELKHVSDPQIQINEDRAIGQLFKTTVVELQGLTIDTPNGRRKISQAEAYDIARFIGISASEVVSQAKKNNP